MILNRGNRENVIADKSALNDVEDLNNTLTRIKNVGEYLGEFSFTVVLYGWGDQARLHRAAADVAKIFGNHEAALIRETYNALNAYLSIIPGNQAANLRRTWLLSGNYADLAFLYAPHKGERRNRHLGGEHLVVLETKQATPDYFNLYEGDRLGALLFGAPGAGKSVLANLFIDHSQKDAPRTFILDLGGSYRQITQKHGGSYLHMQLGEGRQTFRINPFVLPGRPTICNFYLRSSACSLPIVAMRRQLMTTANSSKGSNRCMCCPPSNARCGIWCTAYRHTWLLPCAPGLPEAGTDRSSITRGTR